MNRMPDEHDRESFCLWDEWYGIEEELAEVAPTVRVQYDAMRKAVLNDYCGTMTPPIEVSSGREQTNPIDESKLKTLLENHPLEVGSEHKGEKMVVSNPNNSSVLSADAPCFVQANYSAPMGRKCSWNPAARRRKAKLRACFARPPQNSTFAKSRCFRRDFGNE